MRNPAQHAFAELLQNRRWILEHLYNVRIIGVDAADPVRRGIVHFQEFVVTPDSRNHRIRVTK